MKTADVFKSVTDKMIAHLEAIQDGTVDATWVRHWKGGGSPMPRNVTTGRQYHGINVWNLFLEQMAKGYRTPLWFTFNQKNQLARDTGFDLKIRKGEHATPIIRVVQGVREENDEKRGYTALRTFNVFNLDQLENIPDELLDVGECEHPDLADMLARHEVDISHSNQTVVPCYIPAQDRIEMPNPNQFHSEQDYAKTLLHELVHWTGHSTRLDRLGVKGREAYAFEELVAELGSAFLCVQQGWEATVHHAQYLNSYLAVLKGDDRAFYRAAALAQKAADYINEGDTHEEEDTQAQAA